MVEAGLNHFKNLPVNVPGTRVPLI